MKYGSRLHHTPDSGFPLFPQTGARTCVGRGRKIALRATCRRRYTVPHPQGIGANLGIIFAAFAETVGVVISVEQRTAELKSNVHLIAEAVPLLCGEFNALRNHISGPSLNWLDAHRRQGMIDTARGRGRSPTVSSCRPRRAAFFLRKTRMTPQNE